VETRLAKVIIHVVETTGGGKSLLGDAKSLGGKKRRTQVKYRQFDLHCACHLLVQSELRWDYSYVLFLVMSL
jgi:hypothetical protein